MSSLQYLKVVVCFLALTVLMRFSVEFCVVKFSSPVACTYGKRYATHLKHEVLFDCPPYEWRSGMSHGLFLPIYPLGACT